MTEVRIGCLISLFVLGFTVGVVFAIEIFEHWKKKGEI